MEHSINEKPKIIFLINDSKGFNGGARPLVNWAKSLSDRSILLSIGKNKNLSLPNLVYIDSISKVIDIAKKYEFILVSDNNIKNGMKIAMKAKIKLAVYCQIPVGLHALGVGGNEGVRTKKLLYNLLKLVPFSILSYYYRKYLKKANYVISNSLNMEVLLNFVYGIVNTKLLLPPIDSDKFVMQNHSIKDSITVFVGRNGDLNDFGVMKNIIEIGLKYKLSVNILGSMDLSKHEILRNKNVKILENITDSQLIEVYNQSYVTICIQKQEYFGYVPIESILCGTPSITLYHHNVVDIYPNFKKYLIFSESNNLSYRLMDLIERQLKEGFIVDLDYVKALFSIEKSDKDLLTLLGIQ